VVNALVTLVVVVAVLVVTGPVLASFPIAALGALVVYAALRLIDVSEFRRCASPTPRISGAPPAQRRKQTHRRQPDLPNPVDRGGRLQERAATPVAGHALTFRPRSSTIAIPYPATAVGPVQSAVRCATLAEPEQVHLG
jgi:hypothetical protein